MRDVIVVGGGIVGLATAYEILRRRPGADLLVVEKEAEVAQHQTGHNSGVIHAGVYYAPGSLKARFCTEGAARTREFCREHSIPFSDTGKLVVATSPIEVTRLEALTERARANGLAVTPLSGADLREREPHVTGLAALHVHATGITDYVSVCRSLASAVSASGGEVRTSTAVTRLDELAGKVTVTVSQNGWETAESARLVIVCAGLQADRLAAMSGLNHGADAFRIVPFRGEYFRLPASRNDLIDTLIYPVPDPDLPFLGVHLTRMIDGGITVGPNAVLGLSREGYRKGSVSLRDLADLTRFPGTWRVAQNHWRTGLSEQHSSLSRRTYLELIRRYCPELTVDDLLPEPAGIRAQAVLRDGTLVHDFLIRRTDRTVHVCNAPSPAATSAFPIAAHVADLAGVAA
ncbi:L-2-hydroxyglutarate oxidase [Knoellia subterranea]|uniref:Hydroxyglutarate oxidase n=1 Tax=Knoellia subterranea KCTC 19937 TaxID=1385521 RepID=A0A0A0JQR3_9MICO|nr:L-2-hydroxyglutarate oxidase [Knoellia subterranea]KGN37926.1 hydroxyglutarate oxidase [Knoellia subterranea KCTC 19937]